MNKYLLISKAILFYAPSTYGVTLFKCGIRLDTHMPPFCEEASKLSSCHPECNSAIKLIGDSSFNNLFASMTNH